MKKLILKTAFITLGITVILAISLFGILSFCAPKAMMSFFDSLGLENISGDYAYEEYRHSQQIEYLARAFEIAAMNKKDEDANKYFEELYQNDSFGDYCTAQNAKKLPDEVPQYDYRSYVCGLAARVKYRSARTDTEKEEVYTFALSETSSDLPAESPVAALAVEAVNAGDAEYCSYLSACLDREEKFDQESQNYLNVKKLLRETSKENTSK